MSAAGDGARAYGRSATLLSVGIGGAGVLTYLYFALASHSLTPDEYGEIVIAWAAVFIAVVTLHRPIEQLLSRTIAEREAIGQGAADAERLAGAIQLGIAAAFAASVLALRGPLEDGLLNGNETLYWVGVLTVLAFGVSYFARGILAGRRRFAAYAWLVLAEAVARVGFAVAVVIGIASGQAVVALGMVGAPVAGLLIVPFALRGGTGGAPAGAAASGGSGGFTLSQGGGFAAGVLLIMLAEQTLINAGPLIVGATEGAAAAGFIFNVLMLARAPLVLFQAAAASLLPHLTRLLASGREGDRRSFSTSIRATLLAVWAFAGITALAVIVAGPTLMQLAFGDNFDYDRAGLLIVVGGMAAHLSAVTFNQVALAQGQVRAAAACWIGSVALFVAWTLAGPLTPDRTVEVGFTGAALLLLGLLWSLTRRRRRLAGALEPGSPTEIEAQLAAADEAG